MNWLIFRTKNGEEWFVGALSVGLLGCKDVGGHKKREKKKKKDGTGGTEGVALKVKEEIKSQIDLWGRFFYTL